MSRIRGSASDAELAAAIEHAGYTADLVAQESVPAEITNGWVARLFSR